MIRVDRRDFVVGLGLGLVVGACRRRRGDTTYVALGDSIAWGWGLGEEHVTSAYPARVAEARGYGWRFVNLAVPGETASSFAGEQLAAALSTIRERRTTAPVDLVTVDIGGNDVLEACRGDDPGGAVPRAIRGAGDAVRSAIDRITHGSAAGAAPRIVVLGYYRPAFDLLAAAETSRAMHGLNDALRAAAAGDAVYVDTQEAMGREPALLLPDGIHPTPRGHALIAERVLEACD